MLREVLDLNQMAENFRLRLCCSILIWFQVLGPAFDTSPCGGEGHGMLGRGMPGIGMPGIGMPCLQRRLVLTGMGMTGMGMPFLKSFHINWHQPISVSINP
jgi:hypothetical protein